MRLNLDPRRRAMLREMGIRVWQPETVAEEVSHAIEVVAVTPYLASAKVLLSVKNQATEALATPASPESWLLGEAQPLFADTAQPGGARWLVLAEAPATALHAPAFAGDDGKLLANMLRAARLDSAGAVWFAPLVRHAAAAPAQDATAALPALMAHAQPDIVLVMGRLAALALLPSGEHFGQLRGKTHLLHGAKTVVTYNAAYLLPRPAVKASAWSDLCLAMSVAKPGA